MYKVIKRTIDIVLSIVLLLLLSPLLLAIVIAIRIDSPGPALFSQKRVGKHKVPFTIYKFRTMHIDSPDNLASREFENIENYITKVGSILRKTSLDELPQLINILKGEMTFIGPRPVVLTEIELIEARDIWNVPSILPGVTGWAQINGRDLITPLEKAILDGVYVRNMNFFLDLEILLLTVVVVIRGKGFLEGAQATEVTSEDDLIGSNHINIGKDILILCKHFYPEYITSGRLPYDTALSLIDEGFKVDVITGYPKEYNINGKVPLKEEYQGINIRRLKYIQLKRSSFLGRLVNYFSFTFSVLLNINKFKNYDSIIVYSTPPVLPIVAAWASKLFDLKLIFVSYDIYPEIALKTNSIGEGGAIHRVMNYINKVSFNQIDKVVALSDDMKVKLLNIRPELQERQITVIPNWYYDNKPNETESSYDNKLFKELKARDKLVVSYLGNMGIPQDLNTLMDAIKELKDESDIAFLFAGHGNKVERLKDYKEKEQIENIYMFDYLHAEDYQDALNISDVLIVTLKKELAGLAVPSRTYSFMMSGKPIISIMDKETDISKELISNNIGYAVEPQDSLSLIYAINELKNNEKERKIKGINSRNLFEEKYNKNITTKKYVSLVKELFEAHSEPTLATENLLMDEVEEKSNIIVD